MNKLLIKQAESLIEVDLPLVTTLSNISRLLYEGIKGVSWSGFYLVKDNYLYLGPYQGPLACAKINYGKGVCGTSFKEKKSILVDNVLEFKGHIACSSLSRSEVVVPLIKENEVLGVIDLDSNDFNNFTLDDVETLEEIAKIIVEKLIK